MNDDSSDHYILGREIEKAWLIRGEFDKVLVTRGQSCLIYGAITLTAIVFGLLVKAIGVEVDAEVVTVFAAGVFLVGLVLLLSE